MVERLDQRFPAEVSLLFLPLATCHRREIVVRVHGWAFFFFSSPLFTILLYLSVYIWLLGRRVDSAVYFGPDVLLRGCCPCYCCRMVLPPLLFLPEL